MPAWGQLGFTPHAKSRRWETWQHPLMANVTRRLHLPLVDIKASSALATIEARKESGPGRKNPS